MQREYRQILDLAKHAPVQVLDKDDVSLAVERWEDATFHHGVIDALAQVGQFKAAYARHKDEPVSDWAAMTPFGWLAGLDDAYVADFDAELLPYLFLAVAQRDLTPFQGNLRAWESTVETSRIPDMLDAMSLTVEHDQLIEIFGPTAEQLAAEA